VRVDVLDLLPDPFLVDLALQLGELLAQLGDALVCLFKPDARVLALCEEYDNELGLG